MNKLQEKQNIPSGWRNVPLGSLTTKLKTGGTPSSTNKNFYDGDIPFVKIDDMTTSGKYLSRTKNFISEEGLKDSSAWLVPKGSILYSIYATVGEVSINSIDVATNQAIMGIVVDEKQVDRDYLFQYLLSIKPTLNKHFKETTQKNLTSQIVRELEILISKSKAEQQKIAEILGTVDEDIAKTQKVIETTEKLKRGLMQQLFTRGIGHTKFKKTKIGGISGVFTGKTPSRSKAESYYDGVVPWVKSTEVRFDVVSDTSEKITRKSVEEDGMRIIRKGAVLLAMYGQGVTRGKSAILGCDATTNQAIASIIPDPNKLFNLYLFYWLTSQYNNLRELGHGGNQKNLNSQIIKSLEMPICDMEDQWKIAEILSAVDEKISVNKKLKEKRMLLKKGLMQDLLSGRIRTNI